MSDQPFPQGHAEEIDALLKSEGAGGAIAFARRFTDPEERLKVFVLAQQRVRADGAPVGLDDVIDLVEAAMDEAIGQSESAPDEERRKKLADTANVMSYNLSAALADCWPTDDRPRERRHLETGLEAADMCLRWREQLGKGPFPFSIAWWAKGIHLLALGRVEESADAFAHALRFAEKHVSAQGGSTACDATGDWSILLSRGYLEISRARLSGRNEPYDAVIRSLREAVAARPQEADDLQFTIDQLECARARHGG